MSKPSKGALSALIVRGYSVGRLARELNCEKWEIKRSLKEYDLLSPLAYARSLITKEYLAQRVSEGASVNQLSNEFRHSFGFVTTLLKENGLQTQQQMHYSEISKLKTQDFSLAERGMMVGMLLGDSWIYKKDTQYTFGIQHCEKQKAYAGKKASLLSNLFVNQTPFVVPQRINEWKRTTQYKYMSISHPYLHWLYEIAYINGKKIVQQELLDELTLFGVALWFGDDGSANTKEKTYYFHTNGFDLNSIKLLRHWLFQHVEVKTTPIRAGNRSQYILRIARASVEQFERIIGTLVNTLPDVSYKIKGFDYRKSPETTC